MTGAVSPRPSAEAGPTFACAPSRQAGRVLVLAVIVISGVSCVQRELSSQEDTRIRLDVDSTDETTGQTQHFCTTQLPDDGIVKGLVTIAANPGDAVVVRHALSRVTKVKVSDHGEGVPTDDAYWCGPADTASVRTDVTFPAGLVPCLRLVSGPAALASSAPLLSDFDATLATGYSVDIQVHGAGQLSYEVTCGPPLSMLVVDHAVVQP